MNIFKIRHCVALLLVAMTLVAAAATPDKPAMPFYNPYWATSSPYPVAHGTADFSPRPGPVGPGRRLRADEIQWKPVGPINAYAPMYSSPYPNGKRVIWFGGYDRIQKLDADTLDVLTTHAIGGNTYLGEEEIKRYVATMDKLGIQERVKYAMKAQAESWPSVNSYYRMLSRDNELYISHRPAGNGPCSLQVYGDADPADPASRIVLRREWTIPADISRDSIAAINMTSDGWLALATEDGVMIVLSRDFSTYRTLKLPRKGEGDLRPEFMDAFVRNGITVDDQGGIYVVTREHMHRVQWTGDKLSTNEADGAWALPYPDELGVGSGTTPALMGWGPKEDHLVLIADGSDGNHMMAFWRDAIPADWKGLPGFDRRVAGVTPIHFQASKEDRPRIENALVIYGYGAFTNNFYPDPKHHVPLPDQGSPTKQLLAELFLRHEPGYEVPGGAMIRWNPETRTLNTDWKAPQLNSAGTVCTVSGATELLYCWVAKDREWALEGLDWHTGKTAFRYMLGKSNRFNPQAGPVIIAPNGAVDCGCQGGMGFVRIQPKDEMKSRRKKPNQ